jgi:hypothetical protein
MPASSEASRAPSRESRVSALPGHPSRTTSGTVGACTNVLPVPEVLHQDCARGTSSNGVVA